MFILNLRLRYSFVHLIRTNEIIRNQWKITFLLWKRITQYYINNLLWENICIHKSITFWSICANLTKNIPKTQQNTKSYCNNFSGAHHLSYLRFFLFCVLLFWYCYVIQPRQKRITSRDSWFSCRVIYIYVTLWPVSKLYVAILLFRPYTYTHLWLLCTDLGFAKINGFLYFCVMWLWYFYYGRITLTVVYDVCFCPEHTHSFYVDV